MIERAGLHAVGGRRFFVTANVAKARDAAQMCKLAAKGILPRHVVSASDAITANYLSDPINPGEMGMQAGLVTSRCACQ